METMNQYKALTIEALQNSIDRIIQLEHGKVPIEFITRRATIDRVCGHFSGFWEIMYGIVEKKFGEQSAKEFQKNVLTYHIRHNDGGYSDTLKFFIGSGMSYDEYEKLKKEVLGP